LVNEGSQSALRSFDEIVDRIGVVTSFEFDSKEIEKVLALVILGAEITASVCGFLALLGPLGSSTAALGRSPKDIVPASGCPPQAEFFG
jgi:hypothetical protein